MKVSNFESEAMNHDEGWRSGGRGGPRGRSQACGQRVNRQKSERPVSKLDCRLVILFFFRFLSCNLFIDISLCLWLASVMDHPL